MVWYNNSWSYRREVTVDNTTGAAQTDFPVKVTLSAANFTFANAKADGSDIRFTSSDETTLISHWIESYDSGAQTGEVWVKVPTVGAATTATIFLYYGNAGAADASDGDAVFLLFDDFTDLGATFATPGVVLKNYLTYASNPVVTTTPATFYSNEVREQSQVFKIGSTYHLLFTGRNASSEYDVGLVTAASPTGTWTVQGARIEDAEDPYVAINLDRTPYNDGTYYYVFFERRGSGETGLGVGRTTTFATFEVWDGAAWTATTANAAAIINIVPATWEATGVGSPIVVHDGTEFTMLYEGWNISNYQTGVARTTNVTSWTKLGTNPIGTMDAVDDVVKIGANWYLSSHYNSTNTEIHTTTDEPGDWAVGSWTLYRSAFLENGPSMMLVEDHPNLACFYNTAAGTRIDIHDMIGSSKWTVTGYLNTASQAYNGSRAKVSAGELTVIGQSASTNGHLAFTSSGTGLTSDFMVMARRKIIDRGTNLTKFSQLAIGQGSISNASTTWPFFQNHYGGQFDTGTTFNIREYSAGAYVAEVATGVYSEALIEAWGVHKFSYLSNGRLTYAIDGTQLATGIDSTHLAASKNVMFSQGMNAANLGGEAVYDWLAVRTYDGVDPSQTVGAQEDRPASSGNRMGGTGAIRKPPRNLTR